MALATVTATVGTILTGMYIEGKTALLKDLAGWQHMRSLDNDFSRAVKDNRISLYYHFEDSVKQKPNEECLWSREGRFSWAQAYEKVNQYGNWFLSIGVEPNGLVAFNLTNSPDLLFAWLGLLSIGAAPAMINHNLTGNALIHSLKLSKAKLLLVDEAEDVSTRVSQSKDEIVGEVGMKAMVLTKELRDEIYQFESTRPSDLHRAHVDHATPIAMFYTSGTTGLSKGVVFDTRRGYQLASRIVTPKDRWYICMPLYHATGGMVALSALTSGVAIAVGKKFSTSSFWREVHDSQATWICYVGEIARYLLAAPPSSLDTNHKIKGMLGNGLRPDVWIKFRDRFNIEEIVEFFSSSEGVLGLINHCKGDYLATAVGHHGTLARFALRNRIVPVLIDEESGEIVRDPKTGFAIRQPYEIGGEILVKLDSAKEFSGYHGDEKATEKKYARNVFQKGDVWYRSGDSLKRTPDGRWFFLDRLGDTFRWKGENVSTAEVAEVLGQYPGIIEANVYGVALPSHDGKAGCAAIYIEPAQSQNFDFAKLLKHCRALLPHYAVPMFLRIRSEISVTHNFKLNKVSLREEGVDPDKIKNSDEILWTGKNGKGSNYSKFLRQDWEDLLQPQARL